MYAPLGVCGVQSNEGDNFQPGALHSINNNRSSWCIALRSTQRFFVATDAKRRWCDYRETSARLAMEDDRFYVYAHLAFYKRLESVIYHGVVRG
jgi:hypothetical protein